MSLRFCVKFTLYFFLSALIREIKQHWKHRKTHVVLHFTWFCVFHFALVNRSLENLQNSGQVLSVTHTINLILIARQASFSSIVEILRFTFFCARLSRLWVSRISAFDCVRRFAGVAIMCFDSSVVSLHNAILSAFFSEKTIITSESRWNLWGKQVAYDVRKHSSSLRVLSNQRAAFETNNSLPL